MGNNALLLAFAAVLGTSLLLYSARQSSQGSDRELASHTFRVVARDASITGLNLTIRKLVSDTASWQVDPSLYEYTDEPYRNATFTTDVSSPYGTSELNGDCYVDTVDVISKGFSEGDTAGTHTIEATYVRTCGDTAGEVPPAFDFAIASDYKLTFSTNRPVILDGLGNYSADVHSNGLLQGSASPYVEGEGTSFTEIKCTGCVEWHPDPDSPPSGGVDPDQHLSDEVQMDYIDPEDWRASAAYIYDNGGDYEYKAGVVGWDAARNRTIVDFTHFEDPLNPGTYIDGYGTAENPFILLYDGNGKIKISADVQFLGVGWIVLTGEMQLAGGSIYSTIGLDDPLPPTNVTTADFRADPSGTMTTAKTYAQTYLSDGIDLMIIAGDPGDDAFDVNGTGTVMAANYANGKGKVADYLIFWGSVATMNELSFGGEPMTIYIGASDAVLSPLGGGAVVPMPEGLQLLSYSEW